jgi:hypothetical protein
MYQEEAISDVVRRALASALGLMAPAIVMSVVGLRRLRRYPIVV